MTISSVEGLLRPTSFTPMTCCHARKTKGKQASGGEAHERRWEVRGNSVLLNTPIDPRTRSHVLPVRFTVTVACK